MSSWIYFVTIEMLPFVVKRKMPRSYKLLLHEIPLQWLTWLDCDSEFSSVNGWHDTSTCSPLILCVFSVTFLASAKRKIPLLHISIIYCTFVSVYFLLLKLIDKLVIAVLKKTPALYWSFVGLSKKSKMVDVSKIVRKLFWILSFSSFSLCVTHKTVMNVVISNLLGAM